MKNGIIALVLLLSIVIFLIIKVLLNSLFPSWNIHWTSSIGGAIGFWGIWLFQNQKKAKKDN